MHWNGYLRYSQDIITETPWLRECRKYFHYDDGGCLNTTTNYEYDLNNDYVTGVKYNDDTGKYRKDSIIYGTGDFLTNSPFPVKIQTKIKIPGSNWRTTEIKKYDYIGFRVTPSFVIPRLTHVWKTQLREPKNYLSETEHQQDLILEKTLIPTASRFNQVTDGAGNITSYIYGSSGCNLLAVIRNVSYYDALSALGNYQNFDDYYLMDEQENALRSIPGPLVTTYTYQPLSGLSSVTYPSGNCEYYNYDDCGRLTGISNHGVKEKAFIYKIYNR